MGDYHSVQLDIQNIETIFYHLSERPDACSNNPLSTYSIPHYKPPHIHNIREKKSLE
jgi:hypothetical protein